MVRHHAVNVTRRKPTWRFESFPRSHFAGVAQLAEHLSCKQKVVGSIPISSSNLGL